MVEYIIAQVCVSVAVGVQVPMYFLKNKKIILILASIMTSLYGVHNLLLKAYPAAILCVVGIVRGVWYYINEQRGKKQEIISLVTIEAAALSLGIVFYTSWPDILAIIGAMMFNFAVWQPNILLFRYMTAVESILWIAHNSLYMSIAAIIIESVVFISKIIGIIQFYHQQKKENAALQEQKSDDDSPSVATAQNTQTGTNKKPEEET